MFLTDTHTHLFVNEFNTDCDTVIQNAIQSGVTKMILPGINSSYIQKQLALAKKYPLNCYPAIGLHPSDVSNNFEKEIQIIEEQISTDNFIAVGEIGIDLYREKKYEELQKIAFEKQILTAKKFKLPIIIHVRDSFNEVFEIIDKHSDNNLRGIFHSFTGTLEQAQKIIDYKMFKIGINGIITFKKSTLGEVLKQIDLKHIVLETDSPWLSPAPKRGKRNESAHLVYTAQKIADIKMIKIYDLAKITNKNAVEIFGEKLLN